LEGRPDLGFELGPAVGNLDALTYLGIKDTAMRGTIHAS
jgi:hypothetical protein